MTTKTKKAKQPETTTPTIGQLSGRMLLTNLTTHWWGAIKIDEDITQDANKKYASQGEYMKRLIPQTELRPMRTLRILVNKIHKTYTVAWDDKGWRAISAATFDEYDTKLREAIANAEKRYDEFAKRYPAILSEREKTDKSFKRDHYPSPSEVRSKYGFSRRFDTISDTTKDIRISLSNEALAAVKASMDTDQQERIKTALYDIADRIQVTVGKMVESLRNYVPPKKDGKKKDKAENAFHDSLIENVRELANLLPKINVTGDSRIDLMAADLLKVLPEKADDLRDDDKRRLATADAAEKILKRAEQFI